MDEIFLDTSRKRGPITKKKKREETQLHKTYFGDYMLFINDRCYWEKKLN